MTLAESNLAEVTPIEEMVGEVEAELTVDVENGAAEVVEVDDGSAESSGRPDAERLFATALGREALLSRAEEEVLAKQITRARSRIRRLLRGARRLSRTALGAGGRGVVRPEQDFREREAVAILRHAEQVLQSRTPSDTAGMTRPQLRVFVRELRAALTDYRALRDQMVRANVRLVATLARRYHHPTLTFLDLFQEGTFGLMRAVEKYQPTRGVKFSTYASWWIWQQLGRTADMQGDLIRTPVHWNQLRRRVGRTNTTDGDESALADAEGIASERFATMTQAFHFISTEAQTDDDRPLAAVLPGPVADPESQVAQTVLSQRLGVLVDALPPREQLIIRRRFGLGRDDPRTLEALSGELGVSRERVRQLETRALARLRKACVADGLEDYLS